MEVRENVVRENVGILVVNVRKNGQVLDYTFSRLCA